MRGEWVSEEYANKYFLSMGNVFENPELILTFGDNVLKMAIAVSRNAEELNRFMKIIDKWRKKK